MDPQLPGMPLSFFPQRDSTEVLDPSLRPAMAAQARISGWRREPDVPEVPKDFRFPTIRTDVPAGLICVRFPNLRCLPISPGLLLLSVLRGFLGCNRLLRSRWLSTVPPRFNWPDSMSMLILGYLDANFRIRCYRQRGGGKGAVHYARHKHTYPQKAQFNYQASHRRHTPGGPRLRERLDFTGHARRHSGMGAGKDSCRTVN